MKLWRTRRNIVFSLARFAPRNLPSLFQYTYCPGIGQVKPLKHYVLSPCRREDCLFRYLQKQVYRKQTERKGDNPRCKQRIEDSGVSEGECEGVTEPVKETDKKA